MMKTGQIFNAALGMCIVAGLMFVGVSPVWPAALDDGKIIFEERYSGCHDLPDPNTPPPEGWEKQLDLMAILARIQTDEKASVLTYLMSHAKQSVRTAALQEDEALFEQKCSRCHTLERIFLEPLTDESRRHVVARMQERSGISWLSDEYV